MGDGKEFVPHEDMQLEDYDPFLEAHPGEAWRNACQTIVSLSYYWDDPAKVQQVINDTKKEQSAYRNSHANTDDPETKKFIQKSIELEPLLDEIISSWPKTEDEKYAFSEKISELMRSN